MARSLAIDAATRDEWTQGLEFEIQQAKGARTGYLQQVVEAYAQYRNILPPKDRPWPGCSNIQPPFTTRAVEQVVQRTVMHFMQNRSYVHLAANSPAFRDRARKVEEYLRWQAEAELDYFRTIDLFARARAIAGSAFLVTDWATTERMVCDRLALGREVLVPTGKRGGDDPALKYVTNGQMQKKGSPIDRILKELFGSVGINPTDGKSFDKDKRGVKGDLEFWDVTFKDKGVEKQALVTIDKSEDLGEEIEVMAEIPRIVKDQPVIVAEDCENVIVAPGQFTIQDAPLVCIRDRVNVDFIEAQLDSRAWYLEGDERDTLMEQLYDTEGHVKTRIDVDEDEENLRSQDDSYMAVDSSVARLRTVTRYRILTPWDLREDGNLADAEIVMLPWYRKIVRVHYDSVNNRSGRRNIVHSSFLPVRDQFYGMSLPKFVQELQSEINVIHNQHIDRNSIANNPGAWVDPSVHYERDNAVVGPGSLVPVHNPQQNVLPMVFPNYNGAEDFAIEQQLGTYFQDILAFGSPLDTGRSEGTANAQRTWRGAQLLVAQTGRAIEYQAESMRGAVVELWSQIYSWNAANIPDGKEFRVLGTDEVEAFESREAFRGSYDFIFDVDEAVMNKEMERFLWTEFWQIAAPVMNAPPGRVQPGVIDYLIEMGKARKIPNVERFFNKPPSPDRLPLTPDQEHQMFAMGHPVLIHPQDNVILHLQSHLAMAQRQMDPEDPLVFPPAGQRFFMQHLEETIKDAQAKGAMGGAGQGMGQQLDIDQNKTMNAGFGGPPGPQPPALAAPEGPNQGPGVGALNG